MKTRPGSMLKGVELAITLTASNSAKNANEIHSEKYKSKCFDCLMYR